MKAEIVSRFEKIYEDKSDAIFRFCLIRVSNREQALDITQETFLRLWTSFLEKKEILNNRAFLFTVAHHLIIDWYRKKKSIPLDNIMLIEKEGDSMLEKNEIGNLELRAEGRFLLEKIDELTPTCRHPVYLRFVEDLSPIEIGEILGISTNAASVRINRGLSELRAKTGYEKNGNSK